MGTRQAVSDRAGVTAGESADSASDGGPVWRYWYLMQVAGALEMPTTVDEFVDHMYEWERDRGRNEKSWGDIHEELYRIDLPILDGAGLIEFDADSGIVRTDD